MTTPYAAPTATTEPTLLEKLHALEETAHRLATERDHAQAEHADLLEANCRMQQERNREKARADLNANLLDSLYGDLDAVRTELRRTRDVSRDLAVAKGALEQQIDRAQKQPEPRPDDHTKRWPWARIGRSL